MGWTFHWPDPGVALFWIVALPLFGAIVNGLFGRKAGKGAVSAVAVGTVALSFALSLWCFLELVWAEHDSANHAFAYTAWDWFSITVRGQDVPIRVRFVMDHLSAVMAVMVSGIAMLIHVYSTEYMGQDESYPRFMTYLNLFTASMLVLVLGSSIPVMFVGWEGVGLCSYLLIGFWWENPAYAAAGRKAFIVNRIGDFGVLIGGFLLVSAAGSFEFAEINARVGEFGRRLVEVGGTPVGVSIATMAALFLFLGCTGKSAQLPLYVWLPDAMAGPTPVSALIHAATMVTAGVYLCCRLSPVFLASDTAMATVAIVGALTALLGASIGVVQNQMKRILAYSTVSQLGFMFAAVGVGAFAGGFFHVFTHAFFKACLFLGAGSVMHAVHAHGDADIRHLGGLRQYMPRTHATFAIACLAIAGFPLTSGFFSKDEILLGALEATRQPGLGWVGWLVFVVLSTAALLTAFYMFRLYFLTFWGEFRGGRPPGEGAEHAAPERAQPHESGDAITVPLMILAGGALMAGFLGLPHWLGLPNWWGSWLTGHGEQVGAVARLVVEEGHGPSWSGPLAMGVGTAVGLGGIYLAWRTYADRDGPSVPVETGVLRVALLVGAIATVGWVGVRAYEIHSLGHSFGAARLVAYLMLVAASGLALRAAALPAESLHRWAFEKWRVDELYDATIVRPFRWLAVVAANVDRVAVDGLLTWLPAQITKLAGSLLSRAQNGVVSTYTVVLAAGVAVLLWWFTHPHTMLEGEAAGASVTWIADRGPGYEYRWDFDGDGRWDTDWSSEPTATHEYGGDDAYFGLVAVIDTTELPDMEPIEIPLDSRGATIPVEGLTAEWVRPNEQGRTPENPVPPVIALEGGRARIRANDALLTGGERVEGSQDRLLSAGDTAHIGAVSVRIAVRVRATVEVRNVFGNRTREQHELTLRVPHTELEPIAARQEVSR